MKLRCMITAGIAILLVLTVAAPPLRAQTVTPTPGDEVLASWNYVGRKLVTMAKDFPESKYEFKPALQSRTFAAQLLHVAGTNYAYVNALSGKKMGPADNDPSRSVYRTKTDVVAVLEKSFADGAALIKEHSNELNRIITDPDSGRPSSELVSWLNDCEHSGEHYGQLVVYYRVNGLVPPESRPRRK
ncbi:MAG TPA: DinB family protein [Candidatus Acidoferrales bacterium]